MKGEEEEEGGGVHRRRATTSALRDGKCGSKSTNDDGDEHGGESGGGRNLIKATRRNSWSAIRNYVKDNKLSSLLFSRKNSFRGSRHLSRKDSMSAVLDCGPGETLCELDKATTGARTLKIVGPVSDIVNGHALSLLETMIPPDKQGYNWVLLFSAYQHGANYLQFFDKVNHAEPSIVVVETLQGEVFGGFAAAQWRKCSEYYGGGESFLFKFLDFGAAKDPHYSRARALRFPWSAQNSYFQYTGENCFGMGGGGDGFGFLVGEDFAQGSTASCNTFLNRPLCSQADFDVANIEVWGFTSAKSEVAARIQRLRRSLKRGNRRQGK